MILVYSLQPEGYNYMAHELEHDIGLFVTEIQEPLQIFYEWQHSIMFCPMTKELALQFALKQNKHADKFITKEKFDRLYPPPRQFDYQELTDGKTTT